MERLAFIGPGRLGLALGHALSLAEADVALVYYGRRPDPPEHPLFIRGLAEYRRQLEAPRLPGTTFVLTVRDTALPQVAVALADAGEPHAGSVVLHCSGALGVDVLEPLHVLGYSVGALHPLESVASPIAGPDRFSGSYFAVSGEPEALSVARRITAMLSAEPITVPTSGRPLYHAGAVMVSNYLVTLLDAGVALFERAGVSSDDAEVALTALARGTLENISAMGTEHALTGPLMRGDIETVALHLRAIGADEAEVYAALGRRTLDLLEGRLDPELIQRLDTLFARYL